jgi:ribosomal protein S6--L-glutamate ligase
VSAAERSGQRGFLVQQWIPTENRSLRVVVIGRHIQSYWRVQPRSDLFGTAISSGAYVDHDADADLQAAGRTSAKKLCRLTGLQLVGLDYIFDHRGLEKEKQEPLILEINHFFGRRGLGGSENFYRILVREIDAWLDRLHLKTADDRMGHPQ